jgi:hypothetical protein
MVDNEFILNKSNVESFIQNDDYENKSKLDIIQKSIVAIRRDTFIN